MAGKRKAATPSSTKRPATKKASGKAGKKPAVKLEGWPLWRRRLLKTAKWTGITTLVLVLIGVATFVYLYKAIDIPEPNAEFLTETSFVYYDDGKTEAGIYATQFRDSIPLDEMPDDLKNAVVAAENRSFWTDRGVDPKGILRAVFNNASGGNQQGASTITQQYVKILYLNQERSYTRKVKEAILALKVQREFSKEEILDGYLNTIYFGRGAYGVQAASDAYFQVDAKDLTLRQAAVLAAVLNDPNDLDPANGKDAKAELKERYDYVLDSMVDTGDLDQAKADKAKSRLPKFPKQEVESTYGGMKGHILTLVKDQLTGLINEDTQEPFTEAEIDGAGLRITTTLDADMMKELENAVDEIRPDGVKKSELHIGAAAVEPGTGALKAFYAGQDYLESQINWAVAGGQAGSTFKPFALAAGIKDGYSLKDTFYGNNPLDINGTEFNNAGFASYGSAVNLITATQKSINTAFVDLTNSMPDGPRKVIDMANAMGVPGIKPNNKDPYGIPTSSPGLREETGVALGPQTVSPINMANGYATIANAGVAADVHLIEKVTDKDGQVLYEHKVTDNRAFSADIAADISYAMQQVVTSGTGTGSRLADRPSAGKTGTATRTDGKATAAWFSGFTPQLSTAVMYVRGNGTGPLDDWLPPSPTGQTGYFGGTYPASTWQAFMTEAMAGLPVEEFPEPVYVDGDAPEDGHAPYTPPPPTKTTKKPTSKPTTEEPTEEPTTEEPTEEPTTEVPTEEPTTDEPCLLCPPSSSPPSSSPPTTAPPADGGAPSGGAGGGSGGGGEAARVAYPAWVPRFFG